MKARQQPKPRNMSYELLKRAKFTQPSLLHQLDGGHEIRLNNPNVKQAIRLDPVLSQLSGKELSHMKKIEKQRKARAKKKSQHIVTWGGKTYFQPSKRQRVAENDEGD